MATQTYSLTHTDLSDEFADYPAFSSTSLPTSTQVTSKITDIAGSVNGYLERVGMTPALVSSDSEGAEWAKRTIVLGVGAWCARSMRGKAFVRAEQLQQEYRDRLTALIDSGGAVLGSGLYSSSANAQGVRTHSVLNPESGMLKKFHYSNSRSNTF